MALEKDNNARLYGVHLQPLSQVPNDMQGKLVLVYFLWKTNAVSLKS